MLVIYTQLAPANEVRLCASGNANDARASAWVRLFLVECTQFKFNRLTNTNIHTHTHTLACSAVQRKKLRDWQRTKSGQLPSLSYDIAQNGAQSKKATANEPHVCANRNCETIRMRLRTPGKKKDNNLMNLFCELLLFGWKEQRSACNGMFF